MLLTAGTWGEKSAGRFRGCRSSVIFSVASQTQPKQVFKGGVTHASLIDACLSNMPLYIIELFVVSRVMVRNRNGLGNSELGRFFTHFNWNGRCNSVGRPLSVFLEFWRWWCSKSSWCRDVIRKDKIVQVHCVWILSRRRRRRRLLVWTLS